MLPVITAALGLITQYSNSYNRTLANNTQAQNQMLAQLAQAQANGGQTPNPTAPQVAAANTSPSTASESDAYAQLLGMIT